MIVNVTVVEKQFDGDYGPVDGIKGCPNQESNFYQLDNGNEAA